MKSINKKKVFVAIESILAVLILACALYVSDYYHADTQAIEAFHEENTAERITSDNLIIYESAEQQTGLIFYPGGKVEYTAYEPLMEALAEQGITSMIVKMPFNLAVLNMNAANHLQNQYPDIKEWYIGGHSLGGSIAAAYLEKNHDKYEGLILLASYSTSDLSETDLQVLSIYGTEDHILNLENYEENKVNLPEQITEITIEGGNHAQFGMYGIQSGDGTASISNIEQIEQTASLISVFIYYDKSKGD